MPIKSNSHKKQVAKPKPIAKPAVEEVEEYEVVEEPLKYFVKHSYPNGINLNSNIIELYAGQEITSKRLVYDLKKIGIPIVNSLDECY